MWQILIPILIVGIALALFFLFPRYPEVVVSGPFADSKSVPVVSNGPVSGGFSAKYVTYDLGVNLTIKSRNFINWNMPKIQVNLTGMYPTGELAYDFVGYTEMSNIGLPSMRDTTIYVPVRVTYNQTSSSIQTNEGLTTIMKNILSTCSGLANNRKLQFQIYSQLSFPLASAPVVQKQEGTVICSGLAM